MKVKWRLVGEFYLTVGVPLVYLVGLWLIATDTQKVSWGWQGASLGLAVGGMVMWIVSYWALGKSFGVLPTGKVRVKRGPYAYMDHPMYVGIMLTYLGLAGATGSRIGLGWTVMVMGPLLWVRARIEERRLDA